MNEEQRASASAIIALAGRRIDSATAESPRFPLKNVAEVRQRIAVALRQLHAITLVCSAACGVDLVALDAAEQLGLRRRIVLPFAPGRFRKTSVVDRPGKWAAAFDRQVAAAAASDDLVVLNARKDDDRAYAAANEVIVREAQALAGTAAQGVAHRLVAMLVWDGAKRQGSDATAEFAAIARNAGFDEFTVSTL
jgi:hypothetical protein